MLFCNWLVRGGTLVYFNGGGFLFGQECGKLSLLGSWFVEIWFWLFCSACLCASSIDAAVTTRMLVWLGHLVFVWA